MGTSLVCRRRKVELIDRSERFHSSWILIHLIGGLVAIFSNGLLVLTTAKSSFLKYRVSIVAWLTADFSPQLQTGDFFAMMAHMAVDEPTNGTKKYKFATNFYRVQLNIGLYETSILERTYPASSRDGTSDVELTYPHTYTDDTWLIHSFFQSLTATSVFTFMFFFIGPAQTRLVMMASGDVLATLNFISLAGSYFFVLPY